MGEIVRVGLEVVRDGMNRCWSIQWTGKPGTGKQRSVGTLEKPDTAFICAMIKNGCERMGQCSGAAPSCNQRFAVKQKALFECGYQELQYWVPDSMPDRAMPPLQMISRKCQFQKRWQRFAGQAFAARESVITLAATP